MADISSDPTATPTPAPTPAPTASAPQYGAGWKPANKAELQAYARSKGWSEDFERFDDATVNNWIQNFWNPQAGAFNSDKTTPEGEKIPGTFEKPSDTPDGWGAWGQYAIRNDDPRMRQGQQGGGGYGGGSGYGGGAYTNSGGYGTYGAGGYGPGGVPMFNPTPFKPPSFEEALKEPGYQMGLDTGMKALQGSAAAKGLLRSGGTLQDLVQFGSDYGAQKYQDVYNRAANAYGINYQGQKDAFAPQYGSWETIYGGDLQKYLQKEQNIYGLLNPTMPSY